MPDLVLDDEVILLEVAAPSETVLEVESSETVLEVSGARGPEGLSAYQVAVANGFVGTEGEWLLSLTSNLAILDDTLEIIDPELREQQLHDTLIGFGATEEVAVMYAGIYTTYINAIAGTDQPEDVVVALETVGKLLKFAFAGLISLQGQLVDNLAITDDTLEVLDPDTRYQSIYDILILMGVTPEEAGPAATAVSEQITYVMGSDQPTDVKSSVVIISKLLTGFAGNLAVTGLQLSEIGDIVSSLGTASTHAAEDFATAAQGELADTAIQPGDKLGLNWRTENSPGTYSVAVDDDVLYSPSVDTILWELPPWYDVPAGAKYTFIGNPAHSFVAVGPSGNGVFDETGGTDFFAVDVPITINGVVEVIFKDATWHITNRTSQYVRTSEVGSAAYADTGDFATAAQGSTADSAVQPGDLPTFGDIVTHDASEFATSGHTHASEVEDSITDGVTDKAPSENAVFDALAGKSDTGHNHSGTYDPAGTAASKVEDQIVNGVTDKAPSQNAVFDALAGKGTASTKADVGLGDVDNTSDATKNAAAVTLTNKRITKRITTITSSATPTINTDNCDAVTITALATAITSMTSGLSGAPQNFDSLMFRIKDDGTARAITWGASFASRGATLPTTTTAGKVTTVGFFYNTVTSTWDCVACVVEL